MNLLDQINSKLSGEAIQNIAAYAGTNPETTESGLKVIFPTLISAFAASGHNESAVSRVFGSVKNLFKEDSTISSVDGKSDLTKMAHRGKALLNDIMGEGSVHKMVDMVASHTGMTKDTTEKMMTAVTPLVAGTIAEGDTNEGNLGEYLKKQGDHASAMLPAGLAGIGAFITGGLTDIADGAKKVVGDVVDGVEGVVGGVVDGVENVAGDVKDALTKGFSSVSAGVGDAAEGGGSMLKKLLPLLLSLLLLLVLWLFYQNGCKKNTDPSVVATAVVDSAINQANNELDSAAQAAKALWSSTLGAMVTQKLPDGVEVSIPQNGVEMSIINFLNDGCKGDLKETWFNFDRILFQTGSATLNEVSMEQIDVLNKVLTAYPNATFKLGGYTDNTGDAAINKKLSHERATAIMNELVKKGIAANRLEAEGYGSEHPVCPANDTDECKAKNRRVSLRVTKCN